MSWKSKSRSQGVTREAKELGDDVSSRPFDGRVTRSDLLNGIMILKCLLDKILHSSFIVPQISS